MNTYLILDIIFAAALLLSVLIGAKRGLFKSLMSLIVVIAALIGASALADICTEPVTDTVMPKVEEKVDSWLDFPAMSGSEFLSGMASSDSAAADKTSEVLEKLERFGAGGEFLESLKDTAQETAGDVKDAASDAATTAARAIVQTVVHSALLLIFYILLSIVLKIIVRLLNSVLDKIPVVKTVNGLGGAAIGLAECALLLFLLCYLAPRLGIKAITENADNTVIVSFFFNNSPKSLAAMLIH